MMNICGYNSMVECHPSKLDVACSNHVTRSKQQSTSSMEWSCLAQGEARGFSDLGVHLVGPALFVGVAKRCWTGV